MKRSIFNACAFALFFVSLASCSKADLNDLVADEASQLREVNVTLTGINFNLVPTRATASDVFPSGITVTVPDVFPSGITATVPDDSSSGKTRAANATASEAGITHIALKVFNSTGKAVADTCQIASKLSEGFNNLGVQLPAGTYTFVAVAHSATTADVPCATITSPTEATLPEGIVPTLYCHVQNVTITTASSSQSVAIDMGKRVNATLHITSTDIVPQDVSSMTIDINPGGTSITSTVTAQFNPSTGFAIGNLRYGRKLPCTVGAQLDASFDILLPSETCSYPVYISAKDASKQVISNYTRTLEDVPFQQAYTTNASGPYFRYITGSSLTFDLTNGTLDYDL